MSSTSWVLWGGALAGVAVNVWQSSSAGVEETGAGPTSTAIVERECATTRASSEVRNSGGCERELLACAELAAGCGTLAAECGDELVERAELAERFGGADRSRTAEQRLTPMLVRAFGGVEGVDWSLACRDAICRVELHGDVGRAEEVLQIELRSVIAAASYETTRTDAQQRGVVAFLELHPPERVDAMPLLLELQQRFEASAAFESCAPAVGTFNLRVDLDPAEGTILQFGGSLATSAAGRCLAAAFEEELARTVIPEQHNGATRFLRYRFPIAEP